MIKICHVTSAHPVEDGRIFRRACISCVEYGYETFLVQRGESYTKAGVNVIGIGYPKKGRLYRMLFFAKKAFKAALQVDADIYHIHDPELLRFARRLKKRNKHVVFDSHENYVEQIRNKPYLPKSMAYVIALGFDRYSKKIYKSIDGFTYPGNDSNRIFEDVVCKRIVTTDNYPWKREFYDLFDESYEKEQRSACYIGGLTEDRGITQIIKACYQANCRLHLAGTFYPETYKESIQSLPEYACVEYHGQLDRKGVLTLLQKSQIGLCLLMDVGQYYKMQNLATKAYEYMSMKLPVILNDSPYNKKLIDRFRFGEIVDPNDIKRLTDVISLLLEDDIKRNQMGEVGRRLIKEYFSWDTEQRKLMAMYEDILLSVEE